MKYFFFCLIMFLSSAAASAAEVPVIVIRFDEPKIGFEQHLQPLVQQARYVKQNVIFDLKNYIPPDEKKTEELTPETKRVVQALIGFGVAPDKIKTETMNAMVKSPEVHVFLE